MLIRRAVADDIPALIRMGAAFHSKTNYAALIQFDENTVVPLFHRLIANADAVLLVAEGESGVCGMAAALCYSHWWNRHHLTGQELFWWVDEEKRGGSAGLKLFRGLESWALERGLKTFTMASTTNLAPESLRRFYERHGYHGWDVNYTKEI